MNFNKANHSDELLIQLYNSILLPRMIEEKMLNLLRQGQISKWFGGIGQEAIAVGVTSALAEDEFIFPMHRNLGVFTTRKIELNRLFAQFQGKMEGFTKGRDRSFHFGTPEHHIIGMISHLGPQLALANGVAQSHLFKKEQKITVAFTGEGGTSEGDFHEALNVASVWSLPVIFIIENNGYGLSTPTSQQYNCEHLADRGKGYGMEAHRIDGNNILEVYNTISTLKTSMLENPRPILIECETFRMRGHEEASGTKYVPKELMEHWAAKDPLNNYEQFLLDEKIITQEYIDNKRAENKQYINDELATAFAYPETVPCIETELKDLYAPFEQEIVIPSGNKTEKRFVDAISDALRQSMEKYDDLVIMGQDVADYGGVFKITDGFLEQFGQQRVRNTPLCESAILGAALGLSINGMKSVVEMQFADFVSVGFNQIVNNLAKVHYRWGQNADVVVRMPCGGGVAAGPFHSQSNEAWFFKVPGLTIVYPSNPQDAKGLLNAAIENPNPVMYFEHKALYRSLSSEVNEDYYTVEIGKAKSVTKGEDLTIITFGAAVHWATKACEKLGIEAEIVDLRTLLPFDKEAIKAAAEKTGKVMVLHEDTLTGGIGAEIAAWIGENCFQHLDAPVMRCGSMDTPVPFVKQLENQFLATNVLEEKLRELVEY